MWTHQQRALLIDIAAQQREATNATLTLIAKRKKRREESYFTKFKRATQSLYKAQQKHGHKIARGIQIGYDIHRGNYGAAVLKTLQFPGAYKPRYPYRLGRSYYRQGYTRRRRRRKWLPYHIWLRNKKRRNRRYNQYRTY